MFYLCRFHFYFFENIPFKGKRNCLLSVVLQLFPIRLVHLTCSIISLLLYFLVFDLELSLFIPYMPLLLDLGYFSLFFFLFFIYILFIWYFLWAPKLCRNYTNKTKRGIAKSGKAEDFDLPSEVRISLAPKKENPLFGLVRLGRRPFYGENESSNLSERIKIGGPLKVLNISLSYISFFWLLLLF